jgi:hypothetical protein
MKWLLRIVCWVGLHDWVPIMGGRIRACARCYKTQRLEGKKWVTESTGKWKWRMLR